MLRKPFKIAKEDTLIKDAAIEPYFIVKSNVGGYVIYKKVERGVNKTQYWQTICYPGNFSQALSKVAELILNDGYDKEYKCLKSYISEYKNIEERISFIK